MRFPILLIFPFMAGCWAQVPAVELPARFTDRVVYRAFDPKRDVMIEAAYPVGASIDWDGLIQPKSVPFEMVLMPGDASRGVGPFYIARTEVTWEMFANWAFGVGVDGALDGHTGIGQGLGPSKMAAEVVRIGMGRRPAISMSWQAAQAYCDWLSAQTGRRYRLPTATEWAYALELGGGVLSDRDALLERAWLLENAGIWERERLPSEPIDPFADAQQALDREMAISMTGEVGLREPDALGVYDLLGNAAEWVRVGDHCELRGGHWRLSADELSADWTLVEDKDAWDAGFSPQVYRHDHWYSGVLIQGFRLVCEPVNIPGAE